MVDEKARKELYRDYKKCKWIEVNSKCEVTCVDDILVEFVSVDEVGRVYLEWHMTAISEMNCSEVNTVVFAVSDEFIQGVFTSKKEAVAVAKEWFNAERKERISKLEEELARLKKQM